MIWTREQAKALIDRALALRKADETLVSLTGGDRANVRFARNSVTTSGASSGYSLAVTANIGKRSGTMTHQTFDDAGLERTVRATRRRSPGCRPENPEAMPLLGPQTYGPTRAFFQDAARRQPGMASRRGSVRARPQQGEGRRVGRFRRDRGEHPGSRHVEGTLRLRRLHRRRLQPHGAHTGQHGFGMGVEARSTSSQKSTRSGLPRPPSTRRSGPRIRLPSSRASTRSCSSRRPWRIWS